MSSHLNKFQKSDLTLSQKEAILKEIWKELFKMDQIEVTDNFFDLGGNSLLAATMLAEATEALGEAFSLIDIFEKGTIQSLLELKNENDENEFVESEFNEKEKHSSTYLKDEIAIVGMSGQFPGAPDIESFWKMLLKSESGLKLFPKEEVNPGIAKELIEDENYVFIGGEYPGKESFDYRVFQMNPRESELMDPQQRKFLELCFHSLEDAGNIPSIFKKRIGVFAGMGNSFYRDAIFDNPDRLKGQNEFNLSLGLEKDYLATRIAYALNLHGPALSIYTACSTSLVAIIEAVKSLRLRECEMALAGGIAISGRPNSGHLFQTGGILSKDGRCMAFDEEATGTIFTDGGGVVVLKRLEDAKKAGDKIYAVISGVGLNNDGQRKGSFTAPSSEGQLEAIRAAQKDAAEALGAPAEQMNMIEAHGTGTPVGDPIEIEALYKAYHRADDYSAEKIKLTSVKSNIGHLTSAAGVAGVIKTALSLKNKIVPGVVGFKTLNPLIGDDKRKLFLVSREAVEVKKIHLKKQAMWAAVSSLGVGGTNAHVIMRSLNSSELEEYQRGASFSETLLTKEEKEFPHILRLSAKTKEQLDLLETNLIKHIFGNKEINLKEVSYSLNRGRFRFEERSSFVVSYQEVFQLRKDLLDGKITFENVVLSLKKKRVAFKCQHKSQIVFLMPGQGSHYVKMGQYLYLNNLLFKNILDHIFQELNKHGKVNYKDILFNDRTKEESEELLKNTLYSQPLIFAIELSLSLYLKELGIVPNYLIGHSIGEYASAVVAEVLSLEDASFLITERARLMTEIRPGKMLSVSCSDEEAKKWSKEFSVNLAAINSSEGKVFSGESKQIEKMQLFLSANQRASIELKTSHAFHSSMMQEMRAKYRTALEKVKLNKDSRGLMLKTAATTKEVHEVDYWIEHAELSVDFYKAYKPILFGESLFDGSIVFIEVGPRNILSSYIQRDLRIRGKEQAGKNRPNEIIFLQTLGGNRDLELTEIAKCLSALWCRSDYTPALFLEYGVAALKMGEVPLYPFEKNNLWLHHKNKNAINNVTQLLERTQTNTEVVHMTNANESGKSRKLKEKLIDVFESASGIDVGAHSTETSFLEMGMDSLFLTQISLQIKKDLKVNVGFRQLLENYDSIDKLSEHLISQVDPNLYGGANAGIAPTRNLTASTPAPGPTHTPAVQSTFVQTTPMPILTQTMIPMNGAGAGELSVLIAKQLEVINNQLLLLQGSGGVAQVQTMGVPLPHAEASNFENKNSEVPKKSRGVDIRKAKDSFGAQAKITVEKNTNLDPATLTKVREFIKAYNEKTKLSKKFAQDNRRNHSDPRVVTGFKPESKEAVYPIVVCKSQMQALWDLDGNQYIDMTCGFGSNFFGNGNERIKKHVLKQLEEGIEIGPQHPLVSEVSKMINDLTGNERTAFCSTGSEAVLGAMRLARAITGRDKIIVFSGSYHGINDEVIIRGSKNLNSYPAASGINTSAVSNMIVLDYGTDESLEYIRQHSEEVAAVLVEPVQSRRSDFHPKEFLIEVRKITEKTATCLIFDEIITGFRVHPAGAQGYFGIRADLCTYGKIIGGGMSVGVISGKTEYMDALDGGFWQYGDDSTPTVGVTYFAGTFVRHPLGLAAAKGSLEILKEGGLKRLTELNESGRWFAGEINRMLRSNEIPLKMDNFESLMKPKWTAEIPFGDLFFVALRFNGVHVYDGFPWFVNLAHTRKELETVLAAFKKSIEMMQEMGVFKKPSSNENYHEVGLANGASSNKSNNKFDAKNPPVKGARIGLDENGHPSWFVEDPEKPGEFYKFKN